jgi:hypothetical protein
MKEIKRRNVLKGIASLSALSMLGRLAAQTGVHGEQKAVLASTPSACAGKFPRVNVVLHGLQALIFDQTQKKLRILVPNVPDHAFAVGNFGHEQPLNSSTLANPHTLSNVTGGSFGGPTPGSTDNVVIKWSKGIMDYGDAPYCVFELPWPDCVIQLREYKPGVPFFLPGATVTDHSLNTVTSVPLIYVLSYTNVGANMALAGVKLDFDATGVAHAHIISEPAFESDMGGSHSMRAFSMLNILFDPPLDLRVNPQINMPIPPPKSTEPGVSALEVYSTAELRLKAAGLIQGGSARNCMAINVIKL